MNINPNFRIYIIKDMVYLYDCKLFKEYKLDTTLEGDCSLNEEY